jgi:eukaryotic-like serine/threonine-protein kinase
MTPEPEQISNTHRVLPALTEGGPAEISDYVPKLEGYQILEALGQGGMGTVWRAVQLSTQRQVALKLMNLPMTSADKAVGRFQREVELASRLAHPNIARVYDSGVHRGVYFYAMELIEGTPLDGFVSEHKFSIRQTLELVRTIATAVQHAHQNGIIHRDLKPSNILVDATGQPHVLDFGLARALTGIEPGISLDADVLGTPEFMSPEQAAGRIDALDTRTDIYSLGATLYHVLTGSFLHPNTGTRFEHLRRIAEQEPRRPCSIRADIDGELETVILKALAREPEARYASAAELAQDIDNYLRGEPVIARKPTIAYLLRKRLKRHLLAVSLTAAMVLLLLTGAIVSYVRIAAANRVAQDRAREVTHALAIAEKSAHVAELRLRDSLLSEASTLGGARARDRYAQAWDVERRQGLAGWPAILGMIGTYSKDPPPISGNDGTRFDAQTFLDVCELAVPSPDGHTLATSREGTLCFWDIKTGVLLHRREAHDAIIRCMTFSADGSRLLTGSDDGTLGLWDSGNAQRTRTFRHSNCVFWCAFVPGSNRALSLDLGPLSELKLWNLDTGMLIESTVSSTRGLAVSPDGRTVLTAKDSANNRVLQLWDISERAPIRDFGLRNDSTIYSVALSPDGSIGLSGNAEHEVKLWQVSTGQLLRTFKPPVGQVRQVQFASDSRSILVRGNDLTPRILDAETGNQLQSFDSGDRSEHAMFTPDGKAVTTVSNSGIVHLWQRGPGRDVECILMHIDRSNAVSISSDGRLALSGGVDRSLKLWDVKTGKTLRGLPVDANIWSVALSPDGRTAACGQADGTLVIWDFLSDRVLRKQKFTDTVTSVAFSPDGQRGMSASLHEEPQFWEVSSGRPLGKLEIESSDRVRMIAFAPDGRTVLTAQTNQVGLWDVASSRQLLRLNGLLSWSLGVAFSPDGRKAASIGLDARLYLFDLAKDGHFKAVVAHSDAATTVAFSPDGSLIFSGGLDGKIQVWNSADLKLVQSLTNSGPVTCLAFDRDGKTLLSSARDGIVTRWELDRPARFREFEQRLPLARQALTKNPSDAAALKTFGEWYAFRGVDDWASEFLETARAEGADISNLALARCYWKIGRLNEAKREFVRAIERKEAPADYLHLCLNAIDRTFTTTRPAPTATTTQTSSGAH